MYGFAIGDVVQPTGSVVSDVAQADTDCAWRSGGGTWSTSKEDAELSCWLLSVALIG